jgi:hypothetical protein
LPVVEHRDYCGDRRESPIKVTSTSPLLFA